MIRGNRKITLTEDGILLRKRAEEILDLVNRTGKEIMQSDEMITGDIYIGLVKPTVYGKSLKQQSNCRQAIPVSLFILPAEMPPMCASV